MTAPAIADPLPRFVLGVDDTDEPKGGCTTHVAFRLVSALRGAGWRVVEAPRLVRLNPMAPYRTRGNAAVALVVEGDGGAGRLVEDAAPVVEAERRSGSEPGLVAARDAPSEAIYWQTVRRLVPSALTGERIETRGLAHASWNGGRGLTGALAAVAWRARSGTYEMLAYRPMDRWGLPRPDLSEVARRLDRADGSVFDSYDAKKRSARITPRGHDPVLWGIRGTDPRRLGRLLAEHAGLVMREPPAGLVVMRTNQATDDHLVAECPPEAFSARRLEVRIVETPRRVRGGHVFAAAEWGGPDGVVELTLAAFEPTKTLPGALAALGPGDVVEASGSFGSDARCLNLEKFAVRRVRPARGPNPRCPDCAKAMKSQGRQAGYRCRGCGRRRVSSPAPSRDALVGRYEAAVCARRHLARPLVLATA